MQGEHKERKNNIFIPGYRDNIKRIFGKKSELMTYYFEFFCAVQYALDT
jgi:transcription initiation factor TFIID subunit TAF12